jgi:hypothetical protein
MPRKKRVVSPEEDKRRSEWARKHGGRIVLGPGRSLVSKDGKWVFDDSGYTREQEAVDSGRIKRAKGVPFQDYLGNKVSKKLAESTAKKAVENIVKEQ